MLAKFQRNKKVRSKEHVQLNNHAGFMSEHRPEDDIASACGPRAMDVASECMPSLLDAGSDPLPRVRLL